MQAVQETKTPTHLATIDGKTLAFHSDDYDRLMPKFVADNGGKVPAIIPITKAHPAVAAPAKKLAIGEYDAEGDARSQKDREAAVLAGFAPKQPVYRQGSRADGMQRFRAAFEAMPFARDAASKLKATIVAEARRDVEMDAEQVRLNKEGKLAVGRDRLLFTGRSFTSLVARLGMPGGASTYLPNIEPELRALNVNHWVTGPFAKVEQARSDAANLMREDFEPAKVVLRTRRAAGDDQARECWGVVSDSYGEFDADRIAEAVRLAVPKDARARVVYDGHRTKIDVVFFSNIEPANAVAGEFFQAAVRIRTDDAGGGSLVVSAAIHQNLCLNFIILDEAVGVVARIRHLGSTEKLAKKFEEAFAAALKKIEHFVKAWGYATEEDAAARALATAKQTGQITADELSDYVVRPVSEMLPGIFNGLIERDLVPLPKKNRAETVKQLMAMWAKDESSATRDKERLSRAAVVNAVTRYAHEVNGSEELENDLESAAGALLVGRNGAEPAPLPFVPLPA